MTSRSGVCQIDHPIVAKIDRKGQITGRLRIFGTNMYKTTSFV